MRVDVLDVPVADYLVATFQDAFRQARPQGSSVANYRSASKPFDPSVHIGQQLKVVGRESTIQCALYWCARIGRQLQTGEDMTRRPTVMSLIGSPGSGESAT
jgi:hypothetical protein